MTFSIASYNILATAYIRPEWYPHTNAQFLDPLWRVPAVINKIRELDADIVCLQEVEPDVFEEIQRSFSTRYYHCIFDQKARGKPEGLAILYRGATFDRNAAGQFFYSDGGSGGANSGHLVQWVILAHQGRSLCVANTHLKWDDSEKRGDTHIGVREANEFIKEYRFALSNAYVLCGDLNATPDSEVLNLFKQSDFHPAHESLFNAFTCNSNAKAKTIDFILHTAALRPNPRPVAPINDFTPLPSAGQPSDHLPIVADFEWIN